MKSLAIIASVKLTPMLEQQTGLHQVEGNTMYELVPHHEKHSSAF
jgi:hypothetical protein